MGQFLFTLARRKGKVEVLCLFIFFCNGLLIRIFANFIASNKSSNDHYVQAAKNFISKVSHWNQESFGNIFYQKRYILAWLGSIQKALENSATTGLVRLEWKFKMDLEEVLSQEKILWYQKSQKDWILMRTVP